MVLSLSDPLTSLASLEYGDPNQSSILAMNCLMVQLLPDIPNVVSSKDMRYEFVFLIDRSGSSFHFFLFVLLNTVLMVAG